MYNVMNNDFINKIISSMIWYNRLNRFDWLDDVVHNIVDAHNGHNHIRRHYCIDPEFVDHKQCR